MNTRSHFETVDRSLIKSDRAALLQHLKTPYVQKHYVSFCSILSHACSFLYFIFINLNLQMDTSYGDRDDAWQTTAAYPSRGDEHYRKAKNTEDFKR